MALALSKESLPPSPSPCSPPSSSCGLATSWATLDSFRQLRYSSSHTPSLDSQYSPFVLLPPTVQSEAGVSISCFPEQWAQSLVAPLVSERSKYGFLDCFLLRFPFLSSQHCWVRFECGCMYRGCSEQLWCISRCISTCPS